MSRRTIPNKPSRTKGTKEVVVRKQSSNDDTKLNIGISNLHLLKRTNSEIDVLIHIERVAHVLATTIKKLQMAVCLSRLLRKDACQLQKVMQPHEVEFINDSCKAYARIPTPASTIEKTPVSTMLKSLDRISKNDIKKKYPAKDVGGLIDPHMAQVMELLWSNHSLREKVLKEFHLIEKNPSTVFINCFISLKDISDYNFGLTAIEERMRHNQLKKAWKSNAILIESIFDAQELLKKQRNELGIQLQNKKRVVEDYEKQILALENKFKGDIMQTIRDSETVMADENYASKLRQGDLAEETKYVKLQYENLLSQHLSYEKSLRAKRFKVESQLLTWLTKYDQDMGERQAEYEELSKCFEEETLEMCSLQMCFNAQEVEYVKLMAEKQEEENKILEAKAMVFLRTIAARRIQRFWRAYRQRKIDKKNAKKAKAKAKKEKMEAMEKDKAAGKPPPEKVGKDKKGAKGKVKWKLKDKKEEPAPPPPVEAPVIDMTRINELSKTELVADWAVGYEDEDD